MIPFSLEYIQSQNLKETSNLNDELSDFVCLFDETKTNSLLAVETEIFVFGFCKLTLLKGSLSLNGTSLKIGEKVKLIVSNWTPAASLKVDTLKDKDKNNYDGDILHLLKKYKIESKFEKSVIFNNNNKSIVFIESLDSKNEWLLEAEDTSNNIKKIVDNSIKNQKGRIYHTTTAIFGALETFQSLSIDCFQLPMSWEDTLNSIISNECKSSPKILICGPRGVGKSTYLKYSINKLLKKFKQIAVIDCDLGQPEFTPPGIVSLHIIDDFINTPSHLNLKKPELSYFIGDITSKNNPDLHLKALSLLYSHYQILETNLKTSTKHTNKSVHNMYDVLQIKSNVHGLLPLVINTDGWIKYMGAEILSSIISILCPSNICYIISERDKHIEFLENRTLPEGCELSILKPGKISPSKISAADLRILKLVSYFLRDSVFLRKEFDKEYETPPIQIKNGSVIDRGGFITLALLHLPCLTTPIDSVSLRTVDTLSIAFRLTLALFNCSIVGINEVFLSNNQIIPMKKFNFNLNSESVEFFCDCIGEYELRPCLGLAILHSFDTFEKEIKVMLPSDEYSYLLNASNNLSIRSRTVFIRGNLQLPAVMLYNSGLFVLPYLTGELSGEGRGVMKARNNLKRKNNYIA